LDYKALWERARLVRRVLRFRSMSFVRRRPRAGLVAVAALAALGLGSCISPTLPLPPPEAPESIQAVEDGTWRVGGSCTPGAVVTVLNQVTGLGVTIEDRDLDGRYAVTLEAEECDLASVTQADEDGLSPETSFVIVETVPGVESDPSICQ
jgi:hypothetical protein